MLENSVLDRSALWVYYMCLVTSITQTMLILESLDQKSLWTIRWFLIYLSLCYEHVRRMSKYTKNHLIIHSDFRSRDSSISIAWVILVTILYVVFSFKVDRSNTLFTNMNYVSLIDITYPMICKTRSSHRVHTSLILLSLP